MESEGLLEPGNEQKMEQIHNERREQIKKAALKVFARKGLTGTKMSMIAAEAGISQGLSYRYFNSKDELFTELVQETLEESKQAIENVKNLPGTPIEQMKMLTRDMLDESNKHSFLLIQQAQMSEEVPDKVKQTIETYSTKDTLEQLVPIVIKGQQMGEFCAGDPYKLLFCYLSVVTGLMIQDVQSEGDYWKKEIDILMKILLK